MNLRTAERNVGRHEMNIPSRYREFWAGFAKSRTADPAHRFLEAFFFDDNEPSANELATLIATSRKRATAALRWARDAEDKRVPEPGDLGIVADFHGSEICIIETTRVDMVLFSTLHPASPR